MEVIAMKASSKLEQIIEYRNLLETKTDADLLSKILKRLEEVEICYDDLSNTKIGKTLKKLTKHKDQIVSKMAEKLILKWKKVVQLKISQTEKETKKEERQNEKPKEKFPIDNKNSMGKLENYNARAATASLAFQEYSKKISESIVNNSHNPIRNNVRKIIFDALLNKEEFSTDFLHKIRDIAVDIEKTAYEQLFKSEDKGSKYLNRAKAVASNLQDKKNNEFRYKVLSEEITSKELCTMDVKQMASSELQSKRLIVEKEAFNSIRSDWHEVYAPVGVGMYTCENCKGQRTTTKELQLRSSDEPMTIFIRCVDCGNEWKIG